MSILSFFFCLFIFALIGFCSVIKSKKNSSDYLLAGANVKPWLVAFSAIATNNSGFMFTGMIGLTYMQGLSSLWVIGPWALGDMLASFFVHRRLRVASENAGVYTFAGVLSNWNGVEYKYLRALCGLVTILFLGIYAAAQLSAGSKALEVIFGFNSFVGAIIGAALVLLYCYSGGIRASIWTDAAQSAVMMFAMCLLSIVAIYNAGGPGLMVGKLNMVSENYMNWFAVSSGSYWLFAIFLGITSWTIAGIGVVGQPHIMIRFMTMNKPSDIKRVRVYYYAWYALFIFFTIIAGLSARLFLDVDINNFDPELGLPRLATELLHPFFVGVMLAGLFSATISTADSQILSCSAAFSWDLGLAKKSFLGTKLGTVLVTLIALFIALIPNKSVFNLVTDAWAGLGSSFAPLMIAYIIGRKPDETTAIAMVLAGGLVSWWWSTYGVSSGGLINEDSMLQYIYAIVPGMLIGFLVLAVSGILGYNKNRSVTDSI